MAKYFFHTDSDLRHTDADGAELPNMEAAREEAARLIAGMLRDGAKVFWGTEPWTMTVTDDTGLIFFTISVHGQDAPAASARLLNVPDPKR
jgi:hypothetical protein